MALEFDCSIKLEFICGLRISDRTFRARFLGRSTSASSIGLLVPTFTFWIFFFACSRSARFFSASALRFAISRAFCSCFAAFASARSAFSRATSARAAARATAFLSFFSATY
jgi:hypothetical protein